MGSREAPRQGGRWAGTSGCLSAQFCGRAQNQSTAHLLQQHRQRGLVKNGALAACLPAGAYQRHQQNSLACSSGSTSGSGWEQCAAAAAVGSSAPNGVQPSAATCARIIRLRDAGMHAGRRAAAGVAHSSSALVSALLLQTNKSEAREALLTAHWPAQEAGHSPSPTGDWALLQQPRCTTEIVHSLQTKTRGLFCQVGGAMECMPVAARLSAAGSAVPISCRAWPAWVAHLIIAASPRLLPNCAFKLK